ncbi:MAG: lipoate--protein ligase family protein [Candidatus Bathyarchaeota archaeon]|nr:lipoate--protein ligase family protein [Candidatus Bathyarchaeota archaeon]
MSTWRLLETEVRNAFANMAVDEAILCSRIEKRVPNTLRLFRWNPSAVSIGRFQDMCSVVNVERCIKEDVSIVRRMTGGGAVYHDSEDEITYSLIIGRKDLETEDVVEAYRRICNGLIETARLLGVKAEYDKGSANRCPNIIVEDRKISGSAQANRKGVILQHGTLLRSVNLRKMVAFLQFPWKNENTNLIEAASRRITSLSDELGRSVSVGQIERAFYDGFEKEFHVRFVKAALTDYELKLARRLEKDKFSRDEWNCEGKSKPLIAKPIR